MDIVFKYCIFRKSINTVLFLLHNYSFFLETSLGTTLVLRTLVEQSIITNLVPRSL